MKLTGYSRAWDPEERSLEVTNADFCISASSKVLRRSAIPRGNLKKCSGWMGEKTMAYDDYMMITWWLYDDYMMIIWRLIIMDD